MSKKGYSKAEWLLVSGGLCLLIGSRSDMNVNSSGTAHVLVYLGCQLRDLGPRKGYASWHVCEGENTRPQSG